MSTVDLITSEGFEACEVLKIDVEGKDRFVLNGALRTIRDSVKLFTFECIYCPFKKAELETFEGWGFSCYSASLAGKEKPSVLLDLFVIDTMCHWYRAFTQCIIWAIRAIQVDVELRVERILERAQARHGKRVLCVAQAGAYFGPHIRRFIIPVFAAVSNL